MTSGTRSRGTAIQSAAIFSDDRKIGQIKPTVAWLMKPYTRQSLIYINSLMVWKQYLLRMYSTVLYICVVYNVSLHQVGWTISHNSFLFISCSKNSINIHPWIRLCLTYQTRHLDIYLHTCEYYAIFQDGGVIFRLVIKLIRMTDFSVVLQGE